MKPARAGGGAHRFSAVIARVGYSSRSVIVTPDTCTRFQTDEVPIRPCRSRDGTSSGEVVAEERR